jgi:hypothetical protein
METINLKFQYEIDINNYKKQLEEKIEEKRLNAITANEKIDNY